MRIPPLEWWRLEKVVYGRRESGFSTVPVIKEIIRHPEEPVKPLSKTGKSRASRKRKSAEAAVHNPEEGWDDNTDYKGIVVDFVTGEEVERRACKPIILCNINPRRDCVHGRHA